MWPQRIQTDDRQEVLKLSGGKKKLKVRKKLYFIVFGCDISKNQSLVAGEETGNAIAV